MRVRKGRGFVADAALGATSGLVASWVMERAQVYIQRLGSSRVHEREDEAYRAAGAPATQRAAEKAVSLVGVHLSDAAARRAGIVVHYLTGAMWGGLLGALLGRARLPRALTGAAYGAFVWAANDEGLVPLLRLSLPRRRYPLSSHAKALATHVVYGTATEGAFRTLRGALV